MDITQIILLVAILVVVVVFLVVGIQTIFILKETKQTLKKLDNILGDVESLSRGLSKSSVALGSMFDSVRSGVELAGAASKLVNAITHKADKT